MYRPNNTYMKWKNSRDRRIVRDRARQIVALVDHTEDEAMEIDTKVRDRFGVWHWE